MLFLSPVGWVSALFARNPTNFQMKNKMKFDLLGYAQKAR